MHTIKPLDIEELDYLADYPLLVSMEEHMTAGGLGGAIAEYYADKEKRPLHQIIAVKDYYPNANEYESLLEDCGLTEEKIVAQIESQLKKMGKWKEWQK